MALDHRYQQRQVGFGRRLGHGTSRFLPIEEWLDDGVIAVEEHVVREHPLLVAANGFGKTAGVVGASAVVQKREPVRVPPAQVRRQRFAREIVGVEAVRPCVDKRDVAHPLEKRAGVLNTYHFGQQCLIDASDERACFQRGTMLGSGHVLDKLLD